MSSRRRQTWAGLSLPQAIGPLLLAICLLAACGERSGAGQKLTITGSSTVAPLVAELAKRYEATHPEVRIDVQSGGSSRGIADVRAGLAQLGMVSRALKADEADLKAATIARDAVAVVVHASNPLAGLSRAQLRSIYAGEAKSWSAVGGAAQPITVVSKAAGRSTLELFLDYSGLPAAGIKASVVIGENEHALKTVAGNPQAIAYVSIGAAESAVAQGQAIKILALDGVAASSKLLRSGTVPMTRPLNVVSVGAPKDLAAGFLHFAVLPQNHDLIERFHFVPAQD